MMYQQQVFDETSTAKSALDEFESVFRYCRFVGLQLNGGVSDGVFLSCEFEQLEWYWGIVTLAVFVECRFKNCTFRGTGFEGSRFVECSFTNCRFLPDNLNAPCSFNGTKWHDCIQQRCEGLPPEVGQS